MSCKVSVKNKITSFPNSSSIENSAILINLTQLEWVLWYEWNNKISLRILKMVRETTIWKWGV